jgi:hypothetical protein
VNQLLNGEGIVLDVFPKLKAGTKKAGQIKVIRGEIFKRPSFSDYLRSGWQLQLSVAIDFTASNKEPTDVNSLHSLSSNKT